MTVVIDGKKVAGVVRERVAAQVAERVAAGLSRPGLATVLVGDDPASAIYVGSKQKACQEAGIVPFDHRPAGSVSQSELAELIQQLNSDPSVSGILLQLPLPEGLDSDPLIELIDPNKDVDGLTSHSAGRLALGQKGLRPCTPSGVIELLDYYEIPLEGKEAVVLGRSKLVGKPLATMLLERNATVTVCHSRTSHLAEVCARADVLIAAVGVPELVKGNFVKGGATVIDVGMNRLTDRLVGDVDFADVKERAAAITPVPGGVGPMTVAMLLNNTLTAAELQDNRDR